MTKEEALEILMSDKPKDIDTEEFAEAYEMAVVALKRDSWIPTTERLPENGEYVLLSFEELDVPDIGKYYVTDGDGAFLFNYEGEELGLQDDLTVNAWMPLPAPYREEQGDEKTE